MFTLDISGHNAASGQPGINRFGGLYPSVYDALRAARREHTNGRLHFTPELIWIRDEEGETVLREAFVGQVYTVAIASSDDEEKTYRCGGSSDQEALIYAGKIVEKHAKRDDPGATVVIARDGEIIGPATNVGDMLGQK